MRISKSQHHVPFRARPSEVWQKPSSSTFRPWLHLQNLARFLGEAALGDEPLLVSGKGKKRALRPRHDSSQAKRPRSAQGSPINTPSMANDWPENDYPFLPHPSCTVISDPEEIHTVPVWQHTFNMEYYKDGGNVVGAALDASHRREEELFNSKLKLLFGEIEKPINVDLGALEFFEYNNRLVATLAGITDDIPEDEGFRRSNWLCLLPTVTDGNDNDAYDFTSKLVEDLLLACHFLRLMRRVTIEGRLELIVHPFDQPHEVPEDFPFQLVIQFNISFVLPFVFEPCSPRTPKRKTSLVEQSKKRLLHHLYFPSSDSASDTVINIPFFYSCLKPAPLPPSKRIENAMQPKQLLPKLLPFQRRSVAWLLNREGQAVPSAGKIVPSTDFTEFTFWDQIQEGNYTWYYNRLSDEIASEITARPPALGGILAEEPGLGKTLETIALMLLNSAPPERNPTIKRWDPEARLEVHAIKSTLIVTPPALQQQWIDEIKTHAPSLKVLVYEGWAKVIPRPKRPRKKATKNTKPRAVSRHARALNDASNEATNVFVDELEALERSFDWPTEANKYDVVITTYQVLKTDLNVARAARLRPRRENVTYTNPGYQNNAPRSPLVRVEWFRVVMDEVQMVGGGRTEDMVSLIPRLSSLAVSGTPARAQVPDLIRVLRFLRVDTIIGSSRMWSRLLKKSYADQFTAFMQNYTIRTLKVSVKDELTIPQQTRFLVPIQLGMVERHVYDHAFEAVLLEIGLDARGIAAFGGWEVDAHVLRNAVRRLRGICTHPQVGQLQRPNDKLAKPGTVKTMAEVLQTMRETNRRNILEDWKSKVLLLSRQAQLQQHVETDRNRYQTALGVLQEAEKQVNELINEIKADLAELYKKGIALKEEAAAWREAMDQKLNDASGPNKGKGKGKQRANSEPTSIDEDEGSEDGSLPRNPAGEEHATKRGALQSRLREAKLALHKVKFLQGDVYHMLGEAFSSAEATAYEAAEVTRRDLLNASEVDAIRAMTQLEEQTSKEHVSEDELLIDTPLLGKGGIRSRDLMDECNDIVAVLNDQSELMWQWRIHITQLLTEPLNNGQNEADGQEYQRNLDNQGEAETFMKAYADLLADRREALSSERNLLAEHEVRERKQRLTKAAKKAQAQADGWEVDEMDVDEVLVEEEQPEHQVLLKELSDQRKELLKMLNGRAVKSILVNLQAVKGRITNENDPEKVIVIDAIATLRKFMKDQNTLMIKFENDLAMIRKAFNQRILYFRQLQEISDSVIAATWEGSVDTAIEQCLADRAVLDARTNANRARFRYMLHLAKNRSQGIIDEDEETCILCRCDFIRGFITQCAHVFCEGCLKAWMTKREGKTCPVCRVPLDPDAIQRFTINEEDPPPHLTNREPAPRSRRRIEYNVIDPVLFQEIQTMESFGDYGSKIQTLIRHLLYLKSTEPGAKSIVFSAWSDSLYIVQHALQENGITCLRIDQKSKGQSAASKFKSDPNINVLLLHGEKENAGLNVTCASRVFLLESVVHHSFEIQAIARIDRMGQTRSTEVYCYYAEETVERNILDLAARQGLSLYTRDKSEGTLDLTSFTSLNAEKPKVDVPEKRNVKQKAQKGDFIFKVDDMLAILFPHMYEDVEYLLPVEVEQGEPVASGSGSRE